MTESSLFLIALILYILAAAAFFVFLFGRKPGPARAGFVLAVAGLAFHSGALIGRILASGHAPFTNMYESLSFLAWALVLAFLIIDWKFDVPRAGAFFMIIVIGLVALASSPIMPKDIAPLVPALQSYWLWLHVSITLLGEAFFGVAFVLSLMYLRAQAREKRGLKTATASEKLDLISYRCVSIGFPLFTLGGLVLGMVWAYKAWGSYWSWDPKEVWSLITWFVFALYLHTRLVMGWKGRRSAWIALIGFLAALFTYFGVNYLLAGLHSYA